jgi:hypothetical protein
VASLNYCLTTTVGLVAANHYQTNDDDDNNIVFTKLELSKPYSYSVGTTMEAAVGFRFTTRKFVIMEIYIDVYKATVYSWLLTEYCNKNYCR